MATNEELTVEQLEQKLQEATNALAYWIEEEGRFAEKRFAAEQSIKNVREKKNEYRIRLKLAKKG